VPCPSESRAEQQDAEQKSYAPIGLSAA
jgi:hypothetical protein